MSGPERYGRRKVAGMLSNWNSLREAVQREGTPDIQAAFDRVEEHQDAAYGWTAERAEVRGALQRAEAFISGGEFDRAGPVLREVRAALARIGGE